MLKNIQNFSNVSLPEFEKKNISSKNEIYSFNIDCQGIDVPANSFININSGCCLIVPFNTVALCYIDNTDSSEYSLITAIDSADVGQLHLSLYTRGNKLNNYRVVIYLFYTNKNLLKIANPNGNTSNKKLLIKESNIFNLMGSYDNLMNFKEKKKSKHDDSKTKQGMFTTKKNSEVVISGAPFLIFNRKRCVFNNSMVFSGGLTNSININPEIINYNSSKKKNYSIIVPLFNVRTWLTINRDYPIPKRIVMGLNGFYSHYPFYKSTILTMRNIVDLDSRYNIALANYNSFAKSNDWEGEVKQYGLKIVKQIGSSIELIAQDEKCIILIDIINNFKESGIEQTIENIKVKMSVDDYESQRTKNLSFIIKNAEHIKLIADYDESMLGSKSKITYIDDYDRFTEAIKNKNKVKNNKKKAENNTTNEEPPSKKMKLYK